ncbi:MAG: SDR family NAD(P)-dependent oxidoreductase [Chthoniobacterales bacterium]
MKNKFQFFDLEGKTLLITGITRGIGKALLPELLGQGLKLVLVSRGKDRIQAICNEIGADETKVTIFDCDLGDPAAVEATGNQILESGIPIDAVLHNAAIDPRKGFGIADLAFWQNVFQVNVFSAVTLTRQLLPVLRKSKHGRIIFTGSVVYELGVGALTTYAASKGAISGITRSLAHELKGTSITVNCVVPGAITVEKENLSDADTQRVIEWQTVGRRLVPLDLLGPICLLLSDASSAMTAQSIVVDGGIMHPIADAGVQEQLIN